MRALTRIFGCFFVLATWAGCGDALDLGGSGESETPLNECVNPAGAAAPPVCTACGQVGGQCAGADRTSCCCTPGVETGGEARWQCYSSNSLDCPASAPATGTSCAAPVDPAAPLSCRYCSPNGMQSFVCSNAVWQASNVGLSNCTG